MFYNQPVYNDSDAVSPSAPVDPVKPLDPVSPNYPYLDPVEQWRAFSEELRNRRLAQQQAYTQWQQRAAAPTTEERREQQGDRAFQEAYEQDDISLSRRFRYNSVQSQLRHHLTTVSHPDMTDPRHWYESPEEHDDDFPGQSGQQHRQEQEQPEPQQAPTQPDTPEELPEPASVPEEVPVKEPTEAPVRQPQEVPAEEPAELPAGEPPEIPADTPSEVPAEVPQEIPAQGELGQLQQAISAYQEAESLIEAQIEEPAEVTQEHLTPQQAGAYQQGEQYSPHAVVINAEPHSPQASQVNAVQPQLELPAHQASGAVSENAPEEVDNQPAAPPSPREAAQSLSRALMDSRYARIRDLVQKGEIKEVPVKWVMTQRVSCVMESTPIEQMASLCNRKHISGVPVIKPDTRELVGVVTLTDVINQLFEQRSLESFSVEGDQVLRQQALAMLDIPVREFMSQDVVTVEPTTSIQDACALMLKHDIRRVLVTEGKQVKGIFSSQDAVRVLANVA